MKEVKILKLLDENQNGLALNDLSDILGEKEKDIKEVLDKLIINGILSNTNGRYVLSNERYHLGKIKGEGNNLRLVTKDNQSVSSDLLFCKNGDYVVYTTSKNMRYRIVYSIPVLKSKTGEIAIIDDQTYLITENSSIPINNKDVMNESIVEYKEIDGKIQIIKTLGLKDEPMTDMKILALEYDIVVDYPEEVIKESENIPSKVTEKEILGRVDLRCDDTVTIDNIDTNDIDDAIYYVGKNDFGHDVIRVSIADVPHYVKKDSAADLHAKRVTTSVYTPDSGAIHMYHPKFSKGICSLNPNVDRLARTMEIAVDDRGHIIMPESKMYLSVIRSKKKMDKNSVNRLFNNEYVEGYEPFKQNLLELNRISKNIRKRRIRGGLIDFPSFDYKFEFNEFNEVTDIKLHASSEAADMIEDLMLLSGEYQAKLFEQNGIKGIFRVEEAPEAEKIDEVIDILELHDVYVKRKNSYTSSDIQSIIDKVKDKKIMPVIVQKLIRRMTKAKYSTINVGHFGLALHGYAQFTSPIRRCGDGENHRLDYRYLDDNNRQPYGEVLKLHALAGHLNEEELKTKKFEREADKYCIARYKSKFIGDSFNAQIYDFKKDGIELLLDDMTQGFISYSDTDIEIKDKSKHSIRITSFNESAVLRIGDSVNVVLTKCDLAERKIYYNFDKKVLVKKI